jgi:hypothetical protein
MSFAKDYTRVLLGDSKKEAKGNALGVAALGVTTGSLALFVTKNPTAIFAAAAVGTLAIPATIGAAMAGTRATKKAYDAIRHWAHS